MDIVQALVLAVIQGITEFLPISSTAHLILVPLFTGWPDQGLSFDVALNTATWLAVVIYFRRDIVSSESPGGKGTMMRIGFDGYCCAWSVGSISSTSAS